MSRQNNDSGSSSSLVLAVRMSSDEYRTLQAGGSLTATDEHRTEVARCLSEHGFPDPEPFACIAAFGGSPPSSSEWHAYGTVTGYLRANVLEKIQLAAADDIQDGAMNDRPTRFRSLTGEGVERLKVVMQLFEEAMAARRTYAECRCGPLELSDFESFDTSGDLELTLGKSLGDAPLGDEESEVGNV